MIATAPFACVLCGHVAATGSALAHHFLVVHPTWEDDLS